MSSDEGEKSESESEAPVRGKGKGKAAESTAKGNAKAAYYRERDRLCREQNAIHARLFTVRAKLHQLDVEQESVLADLNANRLALEELDPFE